MGATSPVPLRSRSPTALRCGSGVVAGVEEEIAGTSRCLGWVSLLAPDRELSRWFCERRPSSFSETRASPISNFDISDLA